MIYLRKRLGERSTWMLFGIAITGAAALASPWSYIFALAGVLGALVPDQTSNDA